MSDDIAIGVDIGGTKIAFVAIDRAGEIVQSHRLPTLVPDGPDAVFAQVATGVKWIIAAVNQPIVGIGIGTPGHLNPYTGLVYKATNMYWENINALDGIRRHLGGAFPLWLQKDGNAAAFGEKLFGAAKGKTDFVLITIGTGLGGGAFVGDEILEGAQYSGMEIGHMPLDPNGRMCICGMKGCPEMYVSGVGLLAGARDYLPQYPQSLLNTVDEITTQSILDAFAQGDELARQVLSEMTDWLCSVMIACMGTLNPEIFVIGGGLGHALFDFLSTDVKRKLRARTRREIHAEVPIFESQVRDSAIGAACLVWNGLDKNMKDMKHANTD
ncbi:MAG: ROK family protein [Anaerolineae bacterium]